MKKITLIWLLILSLFNGFILNNLYAALMPGFVISGYLLLEINFNKKVK